MTTMQSKFQQDGVGAVNRDVGDKLRETVSVKDFGAVGDGVTDDTAAVQAALDSGAVQVFVPAGTYKASTLTIPSTVKEFVGVSGNRGFGSVIKFDTSTVTTNGLLVSTGCSGLYAANLALQFRSGSYTNGIHIDHDNHFQTWDNVTTDDSAAPGSYRVANHWVLGSNCWSNTFRSIGAWGPDHADTIGFMTGSASNAIDFVSPHLVHCGIGLYLPGGSSEIINVFGGEIASNATHGVYIGNTSGSSSGTQGLNFNGVYFEDQPIHIFQNEDNFEGLCVVGCRTSQTAWTDFIKLNKITYSVVVTGGCYLCSGGGVVLNVNSKSIVNGVIDSPYIYGASAYANAGVQVIDYRTSNVGASPGQKIYRNRGIQTQENFNTTSSYANKRLKGYLSNGASEVLHEKFSHVVYDAYTPSSGSSVWNSTAFTQGAICWNSSVAPGSVLGWVCLVAGTPGTWGLIVGGSGLVNLTNLNTATGTGVSASSTCNVTLTTIGGFVAQFTLAMSWDGSNLNMRAVNLSGATVSTSGANATVVVAGDARTYTFSRNGSTGNIDIAASSLATGTTTIRFTTVGSY